MDSTGLPNSSSICSRARRATSAGERFFLPVELAMAPVQQLALDRLVRLLVELAALEPGLGLCQLGADPPRVVQLRVGLVDDLLEHPHEPPRGRERQREESADQTHHAATGSSRSTKLYGGSGPTSLKRSGGESSAAMRSRRAETVSTAPRRTSSARLSAPCSPSGSLARTSRASGSSSPSTRAASRSRRSASVAATASPRARPFSSVGARRYSS